MVNTVLVPKPPVTDVWVAATWDEFLAASAQSELEQSSCYYDLGMMRIETMPIGFAHGKDNSTLVMVSTLFGTMRNIAFSALTNASFRKLG